MQNAPIHLKDYLINAFSNQLENEYFEEGIYAHIKGGYGGIDANYIKIKIEDGLKKS
ncbi:MAG: hypothetical protein IE931_10660 [Sphingobacteriales bacterium]|nr:hypothetical protein [Sphingobacteriales bacterium]